MTSNSNEGAGSLRQAFLDAEASPEADTILFDEAVAGQTIQLTNTIVINSGTVTLNGGTITNGVTLSGSNAITIFRVESGAVLNLFQVNLTEGSDVSGPGALLVIGEANLTRCAIFGNQGSNAGGISNSGGVLNLTNCTVANNTSSAGAGGIQSGGTLELRHCTISGNSTSAEGGGVRVLDGTATIRQCVVAGNTAAVSGPDVYLSFGTLTWAGQKHRAGPPPFLRCAKRPRPSQCGSSPCRPGRLWRPDAFHAASAGIASD